MVSNLITPPDVLDNQLHSVLLVDPEQTELDIIIKFCQYSEQAFNVYVYTPNMDATQWLNRVAEISDAVIVNARSNDYKNLCLLDKTYYYGNRHYVENAKKITEPLHYFASLPNFK